MDLVVYGFINSAILVFFSIGFAKALYELGVRDNDKVMLYLSNSPQRVIAYLAVLKIGGIVVPTSPI